MRLDMITRGITMMVTGITATPQREGSPPHEVVAAEPRLVEHLMTVTTAGITVLLIWASIARLDDIARTGGILVAHGNNAVVQHRDGGTLQQIYVHEGELVTTGQPLLKLNNTDTEADTATIKQRMDFLRGQVRRLGYVLNLPQAVPTDYADININKPLPTFSEDADETNPESAPEVSGSTTLPQTGMLLPPPDINSLASLEPAAGEQNPLQDPQATALMERRRTLRSGLGLSQSEYQRQLKLRQQGFGTQSRVYAAERDMQSQSQAVAAFEADLASQYTSAISEYSQQDEQLKKLQSRSSNSVVRAPTAGIVQGLRLNTPGATVPAGATLMELVPSDAPLEALLRLSPNHIGMVRVGQAAHIRVSAFEASHFGTLEGTVTRISADAITDSEGHPSYQVWVRIPQTLKGARGEQALRPGMVLVAAIVTGRHTIMDYLLRPIRNALDDLSPQPAATRT